MDQVTEIKKSFSLVRLLPLIVLAAGLVAFFAFGLDRYLDFGMLRENRGVLLAWVSDQGLLAGLVFMAGYAVAVASSVPGGAIMTIAGGFLFGPVIASIYVVVGATAGATVLFLAAKTGLGDALRARAGPSLKKMEAGFRDNALNYLLVLRLVPIFPFWLVNLVPAFLGVPLRTYVIATFIGIIPATFVYASLGNGLGALFDAGESPDLDIIFQPEILLPILGLTVLALVPVVYRRYKLRKARGEQSGS